MKYLLCLLVALLMATIGHAQECDICGADAPTHLKYNNWNWQYLDSGTITIPGYRSPQAEAVFDHPLTRAMNLALCDSCATLYQEEIEKKCDHFFGELLEEYRIEAGPRRAQIRKEKLKAAREDTIKQIREHEKQIRILKKKPRVEDTLTNYFMGGNKIFMGPMQSIKGSVIVDTVLHRKIEERENHDPTK